MLTKLLCASAAALLIALPAEAQFRREVPPPQGLALPKGTSTAVWAGNTLYISGSLDPDMKDHHDTALARAAAEALRLPRSSIPN